MADITYIPLTWQNEPSTATPTSAENLNRMESGIDDCATALNDLPNILVLATGAPVPGGTPAGTVIIRT